jgi:N-acyl-D-aspartate/D-glutamate deacylase
MTFTLLPLSVNISSAATEDYDVVIVNGRVIDPESKLDAVRNIGIGGSTIRAITTEPLRGQTTIDASGLIISPGFIDLHEHAHEQENYRFQVMDGVTTSLELEIGTADVDGWYAEREGKTIINYGVSAGHLPVRMQLMRDPGRFAPTGDAARKSASEAEIAEMKRQIERGLERGAVAVGLIIQLTPAASRWEILEMFRAAAPFKTLCYVHIRYQGEQEPESSVAALEEVIAAGAVTGAPLHVVHLTSNGLRATPRLLQMIGEAQARGLDVTTELYPYTAASNPITSAMFDEGWQKRLGIDYQDLQWVATGERLTAESFARYRQTGGMVILHMIPEAIVRAAVASPLTLIASDGVKGHPRSSGTYARVLGRYVREAKVLPLMEALRKMTLMPAQRLEQRVPLMKNKGRLRLGADADLTVFDPERILDAATYEEPAKYSAGIKYVLVNGVLVVKEGQLQDGVTPGKPVRAPIQ